MESIDTGDLAEGLTIRPHDSAWRALRHLDIPLSWDQTAAWARGPSWGRGWLYLTAPGCRGRQCRLRWARGRRWRGGRGRQGRRGCLRGGGRGGGGRRAGWGGVDGGTGERAVRREDVGLMAAAGRVVRPVPAGWRPCPGAQRPGTGGKARPRFLYHRATIRASLGRYDYILAPIRSS